MALADGLVGIDLPGRLTNQEDWHITLRFLGRIEQSTLDRLMHGLTEIEEVPAFTLGLEGFGAFPNAKKATVFWAGIGDGRDGLDKLNEISEDAAVDAGVASEERPFRPHLTLSRIRPPSDVRSLMQEDLSLKWKCDRVVVYETRPGGEAIHYRAIEAFRLAG